MCISTESPFRVAFTENTPDRTVLLIFHSFTSVHFSSVWCWQNVSQSHERNNKIRTPFICRKFVMFFPCSQQRKQVFHSWSVTNVLFSKYLIIGWRRVRRDRHVKVRSEDRLSGHFCECTSSGKTEGPVCCSPSPSNKNWQKTIILSGQRSWPIFYHRIQAQKNEKAHGITSRILICPCLWLSSVSQATRR